MERKLVGRVTHYYSRIGVAVIEMVSDLRVGDQISIEGATTEIRQKVDSIEIEHEKVESARAGQMVGLKVTDKVREGDRVYRIEEES